MQNVILYPPKKHINACNSGSDVVVNVIGPSPTLLWWFKHKLSVLAFRLPVVGLDDSTIRFISLSLVGDPDSVYAFCPHTHTVFFVHNKALCKK